MCVCSSIAIVCVPREAARRLEGASSGEVVTANVTFCNGEIDGGTRVREGDDRMDLSYDSHWVWPSCVNHSVNGRTALQPTYYRVRQGVNNARAHPVARASNPHGHRPHV